MGSRSPEASSLHRAAVQSRTEPPPSLDTTDW